MIKRSLFALALLAPCLAYSAHPRGTVSVEVVPAGAAPTPPVQAQAQGFRSLAFDGDMTKGFDVSCANPATGPHQWYLGANRTMAGSCTGLDYPHTDETDGSKVLNLHYGPANQQDGGILSRLGIATADFHGAHQTSFPINAYYECTMRYDAYSLSHMAMWSACWFVNASTAVILGNSSPTLEYDLTEFHGGYPNNQELAGAINWNCRQTCYTMAWFGNAKDKIPGYDASKFHKYGWLLYQTSATNLHGRAYIDDVLINEGDIQLYDSPISETAQRNYILIHINAGCNWDEGGNYCMNQKGSHAVTIQKVSADSSGNTRIRTPNPYVWTNSFLLGITEVQGVTSPINGNWWVDCAGQCQDFGIYDPVTHQPIKFAGQHVPNTGVLNDWNDTDHEMHAYIKSYRVWSCAKWATTQCSTYNSN
jgi:hypothetical protein